MVREHIKTWRRDGFRLDLWDTGSVGMSGKYRLAYRLRDRGRTIFEGDDFHSSPLHAIDSLHTVYAILGFLSLRPGETDLEYFDGYTPDQLDWCRSYRAEWLSVLVCDGEERLNRRAHAYDPETSGPAGSNAGQSSNPS